MGVFQGSLTHLGASRRLRGQKYIKARPILSHILTFFDPPSHPPHPISWLQTLRHFKGVNIDAGFSGITDGPARPMTGIRGAGYIAYIIGHPQKIFDKYSSSQRYPGTAAGPRGKTAAFDPLNQATKQPGVQVGI